MGKKIFRMAILFGFFKFLTVITVAAPPEVDTVGRFRFGELSFTPTAVYRPGWNIACIQPATAASSDDGSISARHEVSCAGRKAGCFNWSLRSETPDRLSGQWEFALSATNIDHRYIDMEIPAVLAEKFHFTGSNGKRETVTLTSKLWKKTGTIRQLVLPLANGVEYLFQVDGEVYLTIQDNRSWNQDGGFSIRFEQAKNHGFSLQIDRRRPQTFPVDISGVTNRTFADPKAGDGKGGWTDQGPGNDMSVFDVKSLKYKEIPFSIVDEKKTGKPGVIVVAGSVRNMAPAEITLPLPSGLKVRGFSLLHASGWVETNQIGEVIVRYADTGTETIPITGGVDVGNWWVAGDFGNGKIAWSSRNAMRTVGLYASSFALHGSEPVALTFRIVHPEAIWLIAGVTLSERPMLLPKHVARPVIGKANKDWQPIKFERRVTPGSALDFSSIAITHKPAGRYGHAKIAPNGTVVFEKAPEKRLRLSGVNLCETALFLSKPEAEKLAKFLAAQGINAVRYHHHDNGLTDPKSADSTTLNPVTLDKLDYLTAKLKEQGIYLTFDIYTSRKLRPGDNLEVFRRYPGYLEKTGHTGAKNAFLFCDDAFENWKRFARNWLTHKNPYTGLSLAEDPAVVFVNLSNEDTIGNSWNHTPGSLLQQLLADEYAKHCRKNPGLNPAPSPGNRDFMRFLYTQARNRSQQMMDFLRNELGARFLMTSANNGGDLASTWLRDVYDVVDDHIYQDHPMFPEKSWGLPMAFGQGCVIAGHGWVPLNLLRGRIYGKPFYITEVDFCSPNMYRAEEGPLMGAYGALQDIDGYFRFNFSSSDWRLTGRQKRIVVFESVYDPVKQLSDRISAALFLRGDVKPSPVRVGYTIPRNLFAKRDDYGFPALNTSGLVNQIGAVFDDRPVPGVLDHNRVTDRRAAENFKRYKAAGIADSVTGEIRMEPEKKTFQVSTPRSAVVTLPRNTDVNGMLTVKDSDTFQTFAVISLDGKELRISDSMVVLQSTDVETLGIRFADQDRRRVEATGDGGLLLRHGTAKLSFATDGPRRVTAVDFQGDELGEIPAQWKAGQLTFPADNFKYPGGIAGYHITRQARNGK
ncbi:hypothetical protein [uncultured Victivallis sp.]|uniref:hypothetical protein n=1 Tax=uncultured Victivallis sp. TaxID=354118 RepID=UPI0025FB613A|nr:hypothetical protein [uncultured Victivallis sp.]